MDRAQAITEEAIAAFDRCELEACRDLLAAALDAAPDFTPALLLLRACVLWRGEPFHAGLRNCSTAALLSRARSAGALPRDAAFLRPAEAAADALRGADRAEAAFSPTRAFLAGAWLDLVCADPARAVPLYRDASERGHAVALNSLGYCLRNGAGCEADEPAALRAYAAAAGRGVLVSQYNLGVCYDQGLGVARDPREAVRWYRSAADSGHAAAQLNLGVCYERGDGVGAKDERRAAQLYALAAEQDHAIAATNLAICYYYGRGVAEANRDRAEELWARASELGSPEASFILGQLKCLRHAQQQQQRGGEGGGARQREQDVRAGYELFEKAARAGHKQALREMERFHARPPRNASTIF
eukprot:m51a1_g2014 hypothetical protein (358) ;mRNA; r:1270198-1271271